MDDNKNAHTEEPNGSGFRRLGWRVRGTAVHRTVVCLEVVRLGYEETVRLDSAAQQSVEGLTSDRQCATYIVCTVFVGIESHCTYVHTVRVHRYMCIWPFMEGQYLEERTSRAKRLTDPRHRPTPPTQACHRDLYCHWQIRSRVGSAAGMHMGGGCGNEWRKRLLARLWGCRDSGQGVGGRGGGVEQHGRRLPLSATVPGFGRLTQWGGHGSVVSGLGERGAV